MRVIREGATVTLAFGRGVGKSWFIRRLCYLLIAQWEYRERATADGKISGIRIVFLLPTFKQFRDVHARAMLSELREQFGFLGGKTDQTTFTTTFPGGSSIQVFPASEHGGQRARGIRADLVLLDEADDVDSSVFDEVVTPWFTEPWSLKIRIASGTPKRARHGLLWRLFDAGKQGEKARAGNPGDLTPEQAEALQHFHSIHATYRDAPENVDQHTVKLAAATMPKASFDREYECSFDAGEGLVYPFDEAFHVREAPPLEHFREFHVGADFGWADPAVLLLAGVQGHGEDATLWLLDEYYESEIPNHIWDQRAQEFNRKASPYGRVTFWPDPSRPERAHDFRSSGLFVGNTDNDILGGIGRVAELMFIRQTERGDRWSRLYISPKCKNTIAEFGKYRRKKLSDGTFDEMPEDRWNHGMDSCRYLTVGRFGRAQNYRGVVSGR
jgi:hypothetical protein